MTKYVNNITITTCNDICIHWVILSKFHYFILNIDQCVCCSRDKLTVCKIYIYIYIYIVQVIMK